MKKGSVATLFATVLLASAITPLSASASTAEPSEAKQLLIAEQQAKLEEAQKKMEEAKKKKEESSVADRLIALMLAQQAARIAQQAIAPPSVEPSGSGKTIAKEPGAASKGEPTAVPAPVIQASPTLNAPSAFKAGTIITQPSPSSQSVLRLLQP